MKVVTEPQPRASLIAAGAKTLLDEARPTGYRGRLFIRSAARPPYLIEGTQLAEVAVRAGWPDLPLGVVVASCELVDCVPVVNDYDDVAAAYNGPAALEVTSNGTLLLYPEWDSGLDEDEIRDVSAERPFGDFAPGRWVWILDDVRPTTERCPRCWGEGRSPCEPFACPCHEPEWCADVPGVGCDLCRAWHGDLTCPTCSGEKVCPPVRMRGGPGLRTPEWEET